MVESVEGKWIRCFVETFQNCRVHEGDVVAILSETQSRQVLVDLSELALLQLGARVFHVRLPTPPLEDPVPMRSTGATPVVQGIAPVIKALASSSLVVDVTVEAKLREAIKAGAPSPVRTKDLMTAVRALNPTTREWFATAKNYALYSNQGGAYDDILKYLKL